jgi:hypothetical protein
MIEKTCLGCGKTFQAKRSDAKFCPGGACKQKHWRRAHGAGTPERKARQREAGKLSTWTRFDLPREMKSMHGGPPIVTPGQSAIEYQLAHVFGRERTEAGFESWLTRGWITRARKPDPPPARSVPCFEITHPSQFGLARQPAEYWSRAISCHCGSTQWVRGGRCWTCRETVTEAEEGKVETVNEAPTIVARISRLEESVSAILGQLGMEDAATRQMVENGLREFERWLTASNEAQRAA